MENDAFGLTSLITCTVCKQSADEDASAAAFKSTCHDSPKVLSVKNAKKKMCKRKPDVTADTPSQTLQSVITNI